MPEPCEHVWTAYDEFPQVNLWICRGCGVLGDPALIEDEPAPPREEPPEFIHVPPGVSVDWAKTWDREHPTPPEPEPRCGRCAWSRGGGGDRRCYRMPPTSRGEALGQWPRVDDADSCGEFRPFETWDSGEFSAKEPSR